MYTETLNKNLEPSLLYRDALMLVIDKPSGLPCHPGPKGGITLNNYLSSFSFGLPQKPELAHRLDKDTSGCLILGRHTQALKRLGLLFQNHQVGKRYIAIVEGIPATEQGEISFPLAKRSQERGWWMKVDDNGQEARTLWKILGTKNEMTILKLVPVTGRTHQLRIHCAASGWPILGDTIYGHEKRGSERRLHLHASSVSIPLYPKKDPVTVTAPLPAIMQSYFV